jgi:hypothetical protein
MATNILTAVVALVKIGCLEIEGLRTDCGRFAVSVQQVARLFQVRPDNAQKHVKRVLGNDHRFVQILIKNARSRKPENCLWLSDFSRYHRHLDKKGNAIAELIGDALNGLGFEQLFADAFNINLTKSDRQDIINRVMDKPRKHHALFGDDKMDTIASFLKVGRNHQKLANWMWTFIYHTFSAEERASLDRNNPIQPNGHRKQTIHQWLELNSTEQHKAHFDKVLLIVDSCPSEQEFNDLYARLVNRQFQQRLLG